MQNVLLSTLIALVALASTSVDGKDSDAKVLSIKGVPKGSNAVSKRMKPQAEIQGFVVDEDDGQVGACVEVSEGPCAFPDDDAYVQSIIFTFPRLRYDRATRRIMLGDQVVEKRGVFRRWRNPAVRLTLKRAEKETRNTFRGANNIVYDLYLEAPNPDPTSGGAQEGKAAE